MTMVAVKQAMMQCLLEKMAEHEETLASGVSVAAAAKVIANLRDAVQAVGAAGLKAWLEASDSTAEIVERYQCAVSSSAITTGAWPTRTSEPAACRSVAARLKPPAKRW